MKKNGQNFLEGAMLLTLSTLIVKVIGALFKIPLANILGGVGMSYYVSAYDIFTPIYSMTATGLGIAASRLVAEQAAVFGAEGGREVLRASRRVFLLLGLLGMGLLLALAPAFARTINNPGATLAVCAIAPAVVFSCISAVYRGYFQGMTNMIPTAKSQVLESLVRLTAGTALSYGVTLFLRRRYLETGAVLGRSFATLDEASLFLFRFSAAAAIAGVTASTMAGALYIRGRYRQETRGLHHSRKRETASPKGLVLRLLQIAIPISLSTLVVNLTSVIDLMSVMNCLKTAIASDGAAIRQMYDGLIPAAVTNDLLPEYLYGSYSGLAFSLFNLAPAITAALGVSALPAVTRAFAGGNREQLAETVNSVLRIALLTALPAGLGLSVLSGPILRFLFPARLMEAAIITPVLQVMGISTILVAVTTPVNSVLQATGHERLALGMMLTGAAVKLFTNYRLVSRPELNIRGVPYGTLLCYGLILLVSLGFLRLGVGIRLKFGQVVAKPLFCALLCAGAAYSSYYLLFSSVSASMRLLAAIALGGAVYLTALLLTRTLQKSDLEMLPNHEKIKKGLEKRGLIS